MINNAIILAAGFGKRLISLTHDTPKPLLKINDKPVLGRIIDNLISLNSLEGIVINAHYLKAKIHQYVEQSNHRENILIFDEDEILETGGGIYTAMQKLQIEVLLVHNGDILIFDQDNMALKALLKAWNPDKMDVLLLLSTYDNMLIKNEKNADFLLSSDNRIIRPIEETIDETKEGYTYAGIGIISMNCFTDISKKKFSITDILFRSTAETYRQYRFYGLKLPKWSIWCDIGSLENFNAADLYARTLGL